MRLMLHKFVLMIFIGIIIPCFVFCNERSAFQLAKEASDQCDYKRAIDIYKAELSNDNISDKSTLLLGLAIAYIKDQEQEKAIITFLDALKSVSFYDEKMISEQEQIFYSQALKIYLSSAYKNVVEISRQIYRDYAHVANENTDYYRLNFLVAVACANMGKFNEFFERFISSYRACPESYLSYKTQGILYLMLWERAKTLEERERYRQLSLENLRQALSKNPKDSTLYKLIIIMVNEQDRQYALVTYVNHLLDEGVIVPRKDVHYYLSEAIDYEEFELAGRIVEKAKEWYEYSRVVVEAEKLLDESRQND